MNDTLSELQEIDRLAQAGLCEMTRVGAQVFLKDIRAHIAPLIDKLQAQAAEPVAEIYDGARGRVILESGAAALLPVGTKLYAATPQPSAPAVPEGWQLVPKEPTERMLYEAHGVRGVEDDWRDFDKNSAATYAAMLQAAPQAQDTEVKK